MNYLGADLSSFEGRFPLFEEGLDRLFLVMSTATIDGLGLFE